MPGSAAARFSHARASFSIYSLPVKNAWRHFRRIELTSNQIGVPGVELFGRYNYAHAERSLERHAHEQAMEFCFLLRGHQTYRVGRRTYQLTGGDVFVTFPDEPHGTGGTPEEKGVLYWLIVKIPPAGTDFLGLQDGHGNAFRDALANLPARHFRGTRRMRQLLNHALEVHFTDKSPLRSVQLQNHFTTLLLEVISAAGQRGGRQPPTLAPLLHMIESSVAEPVSLAQLAAAAGQSLPRFKIWFKEQTGVPPGEYILRCRVQEARRRLVETESRITDISYDLGFSSSQYFATVIKRFTGLTPQQVRQRERKGR